MTFTKSDNQAASEPPFDESAILKYTHEMLRAGFVDPSRLKEFLDAEQKNSQWRGIPFSPKTGHILMCDFRVGFKAPEVVKIRPVIVISPRGYAPNQCIVVAVSSKEPKPLKRYHLKLPRGVIPNPKYDDAWVKCDVIHHVCCQRLDRIRLKKGIYVDPLVPPETLEQIRWCIIHAIGFGRLAPTV